MLLLNVAGSHAPRRYSAVMHQPP